MKKVLILGAGLIGKAIAADLQSGFDVTCADINTNALKEVASKCNAKIIKSNFSNKNTLSKLLKPFDIVVCAVPGFMGFETLKTIIKNKKNVVDISFSPENTLELNELALKNNVTAVVDCGVAPGLCNIFAGHHHNISPLYFYECLVGGLPLIREWPYEYKAVFSPIDVIEEYTRPARYVENGEMVIKEALTDAELIHFSKAGTLESFNTDGLRSLALTMPDVKDMKEKTLRYPGHIDLMKVLRETGFFSKEEIEVKGVKISPLDLTSKLLFPKWKMMEGETDLTIMRVTVKNKKESVVYELFDRFDEKKKITSMARTTGYTCTAAVNLIANGQFTRKGISPPEFLGANEKCFKLILKYLKNRNIQITKHIIN